MPNTYTSVESITAYENVYSRNGINASLATPTFVKMFKEGDFVLKDILVMQMRKMMATTKLLKPMRLHNINVLSVLLNSI